MDKKELRANIKLLKKQHTKEQLLEQSEVILSKLEQHPDFQKARIVMIYSALPDEVQTQTFLEKWRHKKKIILPTVVGDGPRANQLSFSAICWEKGDSISP